MSVAPTDGLQYLFRLGNDFASDAIPRQNRNLVTTWLGHCFAPL
jgi:hypothetical protein